MKMYIVEFENLVCSDPVILIMSGATEEEVWNQAYAHSSSKDYLSEGNFDMYPLYRKPDGTLYLDDVI